MAKVIRTTSSNVNIGITTDATDANVTIAQPTVDYNRLGNKPQINDVTVIGNHNGAYYGLVDAEEGKGLSTNDYTNDDKTKLEGIEAGAEVNVQSDWNESDDTKDDYIKNKPTNVSAFTNDAGYQTSSDVDTKISTHDTSTTAHDDIRQLISSSSSKIDEVKEELEGKIATETSERESADTTLQGNIDTETSARESGDTTLQGNIDTLDTTLRGVITTTVDAEKQRAIDQEQIISSAITSETSRATSTEATLQSNIDTEKSARESSDTTLQNNIDTEKSERESSDTTLQGNIDAVNTALTSEVDTRTKEVAYIKSNYVPNTRTVNGKALDTDITLNASDVNALPNTTVIGNANISIYKNDTLVDSFKLNDTTDKNITLDIPTKTSDLVNDRTFQTEEEVQHLLGLHNADPNAHYALSDRITELEDNKLDKKPNGTDDLITTDNKIAITYIPDVILGQLIYGGTFVPSTATATLTPNAKSRLGVTTDTIVLTNDTTSKTGYKDNNGIFYICSSSGTFAGLTFSTGDWLLSTGTKWVNIVNADAVTGVKGNKETTYRIGQVNLTCANIGAVEANNAIAAGQYTKITYDAKGLVTGGTTLAASDIPDISATYQTKLPTYESGKYLTNNGTTLSWSTVDALPSQSGQSGKFLTTNGTTASWSTVDALPSQTGQSGKFLTTNGTTASWTGITIGDATISFKINGSTLTQTFTTNQSTNTEIDFGEIGGKIDDVQVNSTSIVSNKVANISIASSSALGVVKTNSTGISVDTNGNLSTVKATTALIDAKTNDYQPIVPSNLDYAMVKGLSANSLTMTDDQKTATRTFTGTSQVVIEDWSN